MSEEQLKAVAEEQRKAVETEATALEGDAAEEISEEDLEGVVGGVHDSVWPEWA